MVACLGYGNHSKMDDKTSIRSYLPKNESIRRLFMDRNNELGDLDCATLEKGVASLGVLEQIQG